MSFPRLKYAAISIFMVTSLYNLSGIAASQELAASDIPEIIVTYYENNAKYKRDYLGKTFTSTMIFDNIGGELFGGSYFVGFHGIAGSAGVTCSFSESLPDKVLHWEARRSVFLTGIVYDIVLSTLYLEGCEFE